LGPSSLVSTYIEDVKTRPTTINWKNFLQSIVDSYERAKGIVHGVQKDAIQNGWDARNNRKGIGWNFNFELIETDKRTYLCMVDTGTCGLTGRILEPSELEKDLPEEERWGRFENLAFTKDQSREKTTLGSRGRGKFSFVGASKINEIMYDSFRKDNTYRFGVRTLVPTDSRTYSWDEEEGKSKLLEITNGAIKPLNEVGTRIIIIDPLDEVIDSIKNDVFLKYIGETWWEIIQKYDAQIFVKYNGIIKKATIPEEFSLSEKDDENYLTWIKEHEKIKIGLQEFTFKKLHIIYNRNNEIPENLRGISIQRGGMKICSIEANHISREISNSVYGYITLDADSEFEIQKYEDPEHYSFSNRAYPLAIKRYIESQINDFARNKLGWGSDQRAITRQRTRNAERKALAAINDVASRLGLTGIGPGRRKGGGGGGRAARLIRLRMPELELPRKNDLKVNYGEFVKNIGCEIINDSPFDIHVRLKIYMRYYETLLDVFLEKDYLVTAGSTSDFIGPYEIECMSEKYSNKGEYTVVCKIVSLMKDTKGDILDERKKIFYLEEEPPKSGLFESCDGIKYPDDINHLMGEAVLGSKGGWVLQYNLNHPEYEIIQDIEEESALYLYRIMSHELCRIDIMEDEPKLFVKENIDSPDYILGRTLQLLGQFSTSYYLR